MTIPLLYFITKINSLAPGRCGKNFKNIIFKTVIWTSSWSTQYEIVRKWMSEILTNEKSTLLQVMAWCHQATSHYLSQRWPRSMLPYGITRPQWVKTTTQISWKHSQHLNKNIVETSMVSISIVMSQLKIPYRRSYIQTVYNFVINYHQMCTLVGKEHIILLCLWNTLCWPSFIVPFRHYLVILPIRLKGTNTLSQKIITTRPGANQPI